MVVVIKCVGLYRQIHFVSLSGEVYHRVLRPKVGYSVTADFSYVSADGENAQTSQGVKGSRPYHLYARRHRVVASFCSRVQQQSASVRRKQYAVFRLKVCVAFFYVDCRQLLTSKYHKRIYFGESCRQIDFFKRGAEVKAISFDFQTYRLLSFGRRRRIYRF